MLRVGLGVVYVGSKLCLRSLQPAGIYREEMIVYVALYCFWRLCFPATGIARREGCTRPDVPLRNGRHRAHGVAGDPTRQQRRPVLGRLFPQDVTARQTRSGAIAMGFNSHFVSYGVWVNAVYIAVYGPMNFLLKKTQVISFL